jgi:hypothetical protein
MLDPDKSIRIDARLHDALTDGELPSDLLIVGPAGTGKTFGILDVLHCLLEDYAGLRFLLCRQTRKSLNNSVLDTYERLILPRHNMESIARGLKRKNRDSYDYPNGSVLAIGGLDNPDRILSTAWDLVYINEAIEVEEEAWDTLASRLARPGQDDRLGFLLGDTNPGDPSHWLKKRIEDGRTTPWDTDHRANPVLFDAVLGEWTDAGIRYNAQLDKLRGTRRKRLKEGLWAAGEGQWFETFGDSHITPRSAFDPAFKVHLAVDSGVHTGAVWFQVRETPDGPIVNVFGDYYTFNLKAYDAARAILDKTAKLCGGRIDIGTTDPAGGAENAVGPTVLGEYRRAGLHLSSWPSFSGSVLDGLSLIESFVSVEPPAMLVHPNCTHLIDAFANYKRAKRHGQWIDRPEDPQHPYEEVMDALRGGLQDKYPDGRGRRGSIITGPAVPAVPDRRGVFDPRGQAAKEPPRDERNRRGGDDRGRRGKIGR